MVIDTDARNVGPFLRPDAEYIKSHLLTPIWLHQQLGQFHQLEGIDASPERVIQTIRSLPVRPTDTLLFYYAGHGGIRWPPGAHHLTMARGELARQTLLHEIALRRPKLGVVLTDCGHVVSAAEKYETFRVGFETGRDWWLEEASDWEVVEGRDIGFLRAPGRTAKAIHWGLEEMAHLDDVMAMGALYAEERRMVWRAFKGYVVSAFPAHEFPSTPNCYEISFSVPRGIRDLRAGENDRVWTQSSRPSRAEAYNGSINGAPVNCKSAPIVGCDRSRWKTR
jgi:hypothetical protein